MSKAPAFQFYPSDWQRDMDDHPLEIEGAWIRICCRLYWTGGTATKTLEEWSRILREKKKKTQQILDFFVEKNICDLVNQNGSITITSRRIVRDEYIRNIRKEAGSKGGNPHLKQEEKQELLVNQNDEQKPTPSSSSSSSKKKDIAETPKKGASPNPEIAIFLKYAFDTFQKTFSEKMLVDGGKDGNIIKKMLGTYDLDKLKELWNTFLKSDDPFIVKAGRTVGVFKTQINKLISGDDGKEANKSIFGLSPDEEKFLNEQEERERG